MPSPDFPSQTIQRLAFRSGLICNNPDCATLTVGPSDAHGDLAIKLGEAAHIHAARPGEARYDASMNDEQRASQDNGIWLCASCHTMVDKNNGTDFPAELLISWKKRHATVIRSLLLSHKSPFPLLQRFTREGDYAQDVVDLLADHGAFFAAIEYEVPSHVEISLGRIRENLASIRRKVRYNEDLRDIISTIADHCRSYMNQTGRFPDYRRDNLLTLRNQVGVQIKRLRDQYGCGIPAHISTIIPEQPTDIESF